VNFFIDPWRPVSRAILTHAHSDHARYGSKEYWATDISLGILRHRLGAKASLTGLAYGKKKKFNDVWVSLHSAGHVLGSAQVRLEYKNKVWVVSGDYKRANDPSCAPFETVKCDTFITEATYALPIYHWEDTHLLTENILQWYQSYEGPSILFCYALGKAQRILAELNRLTTDTVYLHGSVHELTELYRAENIEWCLPS
jgi:putative mRNA 3-end processing factor